MLLELFPFVTLNNAMAFIYAYFFSVFFFLRFDMSLLLLTFSCGGYLISIAYCHFFHLLSQASMLIGRHASDDGFNPLALQHSVEEFS